MSGPKKLEHLVAFLEAQAVCDELYAAGEEDDISAAYKERAVKYQECAQCERREAEEYRKSVQEFEQKIAEPDFPNNLHPPAATDGFVRVPREPTEEMLRAAADCQDADPEDGYESELYYAYKAMIDAAPQSGKKEDGSSG